MHGRTHCPGGSDPIPCLPNAGGQTTYPELVAAHPCLAHYWPADEASGDLIDRKGSWDLVRTTADVSGVTYPQYGAAGPFTEQPEYTAVVNAGVQGVPADDHGRFAYSFGSAPPYWTSTNDFTLELWLYLTSYATTGASSVLEIGTAGGTTLGFALNPSAGSGSPANLGFNRGAVQLADPDIFPLDSWQHLVGRYDGTTLELFRNGGLVDSDTAGSTSITGAIAWLNVQSGPSWFPTNGRSAHLAFYDCALTDAEISAHRAAQTASPNASAGSVLTADGEGSFSFQPPTIEIEF